jgi:hypothetical protein
MDLKDLQAVLTFSIGFRVFRFLRIKGRAMRRKTAANNRERERERERCGTDEEENSGEQYREFSTRWVSICEDFDYRSVRRRARILA